jgi:hypothetical protein
MAIAFRSKSQVIGTAQNATPTEPAGAASGDFFLGIAIVDTGAGATGTISLPSGWTTLRSLGVSPSGTFRYLSGYVIRGGSAPNLTFTMPRSDYREVHVAAWSGVDTTSPIDVLAAAVGTLTASTSKADPPSVAPVDTAALAIAIMWHWGGAPVSGGWLAPTNYTRRTGETAGSSSAVADRQLASGSVEDPGTFGGTPQGAEPSVADTFALKPAGGGASVAKMLAALGVG